MGRYPRAYCPTLCYCHSSQHAHFKSEVFAHNAHDGYVHFSAIWLKNVLESKRLCPFWLTFGTFDIALVYGSSLFSCMISIHGGWTYKIEKWQPKFWKYVWNVYSKYVGIVYQVRSSINPLNPSNKQQFIWCWRNLYCNWIIYTSQNMEVVSYPRSHLYTRNKHQGTFVPCHLGPLIKDEDRTHPQSGLAENLSPCFLNASTQKDIT